MDQDDIVQDLAPLHISRLILGDDEREDGFKPEGNNFSNYFVDDIA
jgi:hypothetical protein